jgi:hypothetical protein
MLNQQILGLLPLGQQPIRFSEYLIRSCLPSGTEYIGIPVSINGVILSVQMTVGFIGKPTTGGNTSVTIV